MLEIINLGHRIYHHRDHTDFNLHRLLVFWLRGFKHTKLMLQLADFFAACSELHALEQGNAIFYEQLARQVFYYRSTMAQRQRLIEQHFSLCRQQFSFAALQRIYYDERLLLWQDDQGMSLGLDFFYVDRKEGLMTLDLMKGTWRVYHITFWLDRNEQQERCLYIGALQGSLGGRASIQALTKKFFGCRPKNLMLYGLQQLAGALRVKHIYAVSNQGFFTNNHLRLDRKLKTSLDSFWQESGGRPLTDSRFYELPVASHRKALEEIKSHKRSQYRKRYAWLDQVSASMADSLSEYLLP